MLNSEILPVNTAQVEGQKLVGGGEIQVRDNHSLRVLHARLMAVGSSCLRCTTTPIKNRRTQAIRNFEGSRNRWFAERPRHLTVRLLAARGAPALLLAPDRVVLLNSSRIGLLASDLEI